MLQVILQSSLVVLIFMTLIFVIATLKKDNSIADVAWGLGFMVISFYLLMRIGTYFPRQILITGMVSVWGLRLALHVGARNRQHGEDPRYAQWRKEWGKWVVIRAFFQVFILQGLIMLAIALPLMLMHTFSGPQLLWTDFLGIGIWITGFYFEAVGDWQLADFLSKEKNRGKIMDQGLWRYTRHPNYFGESLLWWGIFLMATPLPYWYISIAGPIVLTFFLLGVSGIPMLERAMKDDPKFQEYARKTSAFFPLPPKE